MGYCHSLSEFLNLIHFSHCRTNKTTSSYWSMDNNGNCYHSNVWDIESSGRNNDGYRYVCTVRDTCSNSTTYILHYFDRVSIRYDLLYIYRNSSWLFQTSTLSNISFLTYSRHLRSPVNCSLFHTQYSLSNIWRRLPHALASDVDQLILIKQAILWHCTWELFVSLKRRNQLFLLEYALRIFYP